MKAYPCPKIYFVNSIGDIRIFPGYIFDGTAKQIIHYAKLEIKGMRKI
jgi:hypothetical protein